MLFTLIQNSGTDGPHDYAEDEEPNGKHCVVHCGLLSASMAPPPVSIEDSDRHGQRDTGDDK